MLNIVLILGFASMISIGGLSALSAGNQQALAINHNVTAKLEANTATTECYVQQSLQRIKGRTWDGYNWVDTSVDCGVENESAKERANHILRTNYNFTTTETAIVPNGNSSVWDGVRTTTRPYAALGFIKLTFVEAYQATGALPTATEWYDDTANFGEWSKSLVKKHIAGANNATGTYQPGASNCGINDSEVSIFNGQTRRDNCIAAINVIRNLVAAELGI